MNDNLYKQILDQSPLGYAYHEIILDENNKPCDYKFIEVNNSFEDLTGLKRSEVIGKRISEVLPDIRNSEFDWIALYGNIAINGGSEEFEQFSDALKKWYKVKVYSPEKGLFITAFSDITNERNQIEELYKLSVMSEELLQGLEESDFQKITDDLLDITESKFVSFNLYEHDGKHYTTKIIAGDRGIANKALDIVGIKIDEKKWPHDPIRAEKIKDKMVTHFLNLHDLAGKVIPKTVCDLLTMSFGIGEVVVVKIMKNNIMLGDFTLIMPKGKAFKKDSIVEIYANQVGLAIVNMREEEKIIKSEEQYRLLTTQMQLGLVLNEIICDDQGNPVDYRFISFNESYEKITGLSREDILGKTVLEVLPNTEKYWIEIFGRVALTGKEDRFENYSAALGRYFSTVVYSPKIGQFAVIVDDITDRKAMEKQIFNEKEQFKTTLLSVGDGVISVDAQGKVLILNQIAEKLTGWTQEEAQGKSIEEVFHIINELTGKRRDNPVQKVLDNDEIIELDNHTILISKDGTKRPIEDSAAPIKDAQGNLTGVVLVFRDFSEKKKSLDEITYLSFHDHLTGLYNRSFFDAELKRLDTQRNLPMTIIMGDVNGLKLINDTFGHSVGDELLIKVGKILKSCCRGDDIIARVGGDEYSILLPQTDGIEAQKLIKRIQESMKDEKVRDLDVSVSFGWATKTDVSQTKDFINKKAEDFMYSNKLFDGPSFRGRVIDNIVMAINAKSPREEAHSKRVSALCVALGEALEVDEGMIKTLKIFGLLHDIGKIAIADDILNKTSGLTEREYYEIKRHSEIGYRILSTVNDMAEIANYVLYHHERWDGNGYPKGMAGGSIPLPSRICTIVDAYDAMTSDRSYRPAMTDEYAMNELQKNAGTQFDPYLVDVFLNKVISN